MKKAVLDHFEKVDKRLFRVIDTDIKKFSLSQKKKTDDEYFISLCRSIVGQQLSGKAARSIYERFESIFPKKKVVAKKIAKMTEHELRNVGMSYAKARALINYSEKYIEGSVTYKNIRKKTNEEIKEMLLQIKGVGPWTTDMFLMFSLNREDVFAPKDLGLQKGIQKIYKLKEKPDEEKVLKLSKKWAPYRTYASVILWHTLDNQ